MRPAGRLAPVMWSPLRRPNWRRLLYRHVHVVTAREVAADAQEAVALVAQVEQPGDLDGLADERLLLAALPLALAVAALTISALTISALAVIPLTVGPLTISAALTITVTVAAPTTAAAVAGLALVVATTAVLVAVTISSIAVTLTGGGRVGGGRSSSLAVTGLGGRARVLAEGDFPLGRRLLGLGRGITIHLRFGHCFGRCRLARRRPTRRPTGRRLRGRLLGV